MRWRWVLIGGWCPLLLAASGVIFYLATLYPAGPPQRGTLALVGADSAHLPETRTAARCHSADRRWGDHRGRSGGHSCGAVGCHVVDLRGFTVLPGLIDLHTHFGSPDLEAREQPGPTTLPRMLPDQARQMVREVATGDDRVDLIKVVRDRGGPNRALQPITQDVLDAIVAEAQCASGPVSIVSWSCLSEAAWLRSRRCRQPPWMRPACWGRTV
jgi:hypothetical protein